MASNVNRISLYAQNKQSVSFPFASSVRKYFHLVACLIRLYFHEVVFHRSLDTKFFFTIFSIKS